MSTEPSAADLAAAQALLAQHEAAQRAKSAAAARATLDAVAAFRAASAPAVDALRQAVSALQSAIAEAGGFDQVPASVDAIAGNVRGLDWLENMSLQIEGQANLALDRAAKAEARAAAANGDA